ncbi:MAG: acetyl-CoA acetyltransferase [Acidimicrobiales bacterium]
MSIAGLDPRTPVLVGVGQLIQKPDNPVEALEPVAMMQAVLEAAADDAGSRTLLDRATDTWVIKGAWPYTDPGAILSQRFGNSSRTALSTDGGNTPQSLVNKASLRIQQGEADVVMIVGAEGIWSRRRARRAGERIPYTEQAPTTPTEALGADVTMSHRVETGRGLEAPINFYPLFESAFRASRGESMDDHRDRVSTLWEGFNKVAVANPYAWARTPMTAAQIREPDNGNRMVGFPYTKSMNSNWDLDQAAGLILCSAETATALGISTDRWVFPQSGTDGRDTNFVSNRHSLHESPAIRIAGAKAFELAETTAQDVDHVDLYSCFPSAVQIGATELGLGLDRQLTQTGGLTFAGGPLNNYVTHGIATMANVLRNDAGSVGLCSANGGYVTKHAFGVYSTNPAAAGFRHADCQNEIDQHPTTELDADYVGAATIEAYTVMHGVDGPERGLAAIRTPNGRQWANTTDQDLMAQMITSEHIGRDVEITPEFTFELS